MLELGRGLAALPMLFGKKIIHGNSEKVCKHNEHADIGNALCSLPFGDGFVRIVDLFRKLRLGQMAFLPVVGYVGSNQLLHLIIISNSHGKIIHDTKSKCNTFIFSNKIKHSTVSREA